MTLLILLTFASILLFPLPSNKSEIYTHNFPSNKRGLRGVLEDWGFSGAALAQTCSPTLLGNTTTAGTFIDVFVSGNYAYIAETNTTTTVVCQCSDDSIPPTGCVSGRVTNLACQSLVGRIVKLKRTFPRTPLIIKVTFTGNGGGYSFTDLGDGIYKTKVKKCIGGGSQTRTISEGGKVNDVNFECKR